jgi:hypothetical protein
MSQHQEMLRNCRLPEQHHLRVSLLQLRHPPHRLYRLLRFQLGLAREQVWEQEESQLAALKTNRL